MKTLHRKEKVYPQIDKAFRCIDTYNRKTSIALWVHPLNLYHFGKKKSHFHLGWFYAGN